MQLHCGMCKLKDIFLTTFSQTFRKSKIKRNWFDMNQDGIRQDCLQRFTLHHRPNLKNLSRGKSIKNQPMGIVVYISITQGKMI